MQRRGGGFTWRGCAFRIGFDSATILLQFLLQNGHDFRHDRATIGPQSDRDRAMIVVLVLRRSPAGGLDTNARRSHDRISSIAARSHRDRGLIGLRSWSSSTMFRRRWIELQVIWMVTIARHRGRRIAIERGVNHQPSICEDRDEDYYEQSGASIWRCPLRRLMEITWSSSR